MGYTYIHAYIHTHSYILTYEKQVCIALSDHQHQHIHQLEDSHHVQVDCEHEVGRLLPTRQTHTHIHTFITLSYRIARHIYSTYSYMLYCGGMRMDGAVWILKNRKKYLRTDKTNNLKNLHRYIHTYIHTWSYQEIATVKGKKARFHVCIPSRMNSMIN